MCGVCGCVCAYECTSVCMCVWFHVCECDHVLQNLKEFSECQISEISRLETKTVKNGLLNFCFLLSACVCVCVSVCVCKCVGMKV